MIVLKWIYHLTLDGVNIRGWGGVQPPPPFPGLDITPHPRFWKGYLFSKLHNQIVIIQWLFT